MAGRGWSTFWNTFFSELDWCIRVIFLWLLVDKLDMWKYRNWVSLIWKWLPLPWKQNKCSTLKFYIFLFAKKGVSESASSPASHIEVTHYKCKRNHRSLLQSFKVNGPVVSEEIFHISAQRNCCDLWCMSMTSLNFSHFNLLLWNHWDFWTNTL
jgi:hypothetical protein